MVTFAEHWDLGYIPPGCTSTQLLRPVCAGLLRAIRVEGADRPAMFDGVRLSVRGSIRYLCMDAMPFVVDGLTFDDRVGEHDPIELSVHNGSATTCHLEGDFVIVPTSTTLESGSGS